MLLIAGGAGFLGLNTAQVLADAGEEVVITTRRRSDPIADAVVKAAGGRIVMETADLNNPHEVYGLLSRYRIDTVAHTATNHMFAQSRSANFTSYNMLFNMLEAANATGVRRFVLASSLAVYRGTPGPWKETATFPVRADEERGEALKFVPDFEIVFKRVLEMVTLDYGTPLKVWDRAPAGRGQGRSEPLETAVVRFATQCGPLYSSMYNPTACLAHALAKGHDALPADRPLRPTSDVGYVRDNADGLKTVMLAERLPHRIYNVSSGLFVTGREIAEAAQRIDPAGAARLGLDPAAAAVGTGDERFDISRMREDFGWSPKFGTMDAVLSDYVAWLRDHDY